MKRRHGFTLVELMVSMALIIFIMAILSQAFVAALNTFRNLKGQGDLAEKLRATAQILQHDLAADHFGSNRRLSDPTFWNNGPPQQGFFQVYHGSGSLGPNNYTEGSDVSGVRSYRSTDHKLAFTVRLVGNDIGDFMYSSAMGSGNTGLVPELPLGIGSVQAFGPPESRYQALAPIPILTGYNSQWAAVAWFLQPQLNPATLVQDQTTPDPSVSNPLTGLPPYPGVPLYTLYRRQCLLVPDNNLVTLATVPQTIALGQPLPGVPSSRWPNFLEMSCLPDPNKGSAILNFNSPRDITMPANRGITATSLTSGIFSGWGGQVANTPLPAGLLPGAAYPPLPAGPLLGSDIQLNDVVSFDVRVLPLYPSLPQPWLFPSVDKFITMQDIFFQQNFPQFTDLPKLPLGAKVFDTWSSYSNGINDYSTWNTPGNKGISIPWWTTNSMTYQFPVGTGRTITLPGANTTFPGLGSGPIIQAIQVTIRIWDFKTNQTRQVTIVQAM